MNEKRRAILAGCFARVFGHVDDSFIDDVAPLLKWMNVPAGAVLMHEGDPSDGAYFVISGRLRACTTVDGRSVRVGEIGRGETVGEMGVLTGDPRSATVVAARDSIVTHASGEVFDDLLHRNAELAIHMARVLVDRLKRTSAERESSRPSSFCLVPISEGVDLTRFVAQLGEALERWGRTAVVDRAAVDAEFGEGAADAPADETESLSSHLDDLELLHDVVLFVADGEETTWTQRCVQHADEILLIAHAHASPAVGPLERICSGTAARKTLVLLHEGDEVYAEGTAAWLEAREVEAHVHVRRDSHRDLARLARIISGNAVGLVLGGGGARGFAHLGVYKALREAGIDVDFVGGTSIGAIIAAWISLDRGVEETIERSRRSTEGNPTGDFNFVPMISLIRGQRLRGAIADAVGAAWRPGLAVDVADTWKNLFCVATSYTAAREVVLTRGPLDRAILASVSIPVALPPVVWQRQLLIDGGVFNNFPTDVMARMGARWIIGVDIGQRQVREVDFDEVPGPLRLAWDGLRRAAARHYPVPSLGSLIVDTTMLNSDARRASARQLTHLYFNPDVSKIALLDWKAFDAAVEIGYRHARDVLAAMSDEQLAPYRSAGVPTPDAPSGEPAIAHA